MSHGVIVAGTERFEESRWHDDTLEGLPYDDILWGYMVRICEEQRAYTGDKSPCTELVYAGYMVVPCPKY